MESSVKKNKTTEELEEIAAKEKELKELRKIKSELEAMLIRENRMEIFEKCLFLN